MMSFMTGLLNKTQSIRFYVYLDSHSISFWSKIFSVVVRKTGRYRGCVKSLSAVVQFNGNRKVSAWQLLVPCLCLVVQLEFYFFTDQIT